MQKITKKLNKLYALIFFEKKRALLVIFDLKTLSNRDENRKFVISSPDLPKTDVKVYANV